MDDAPTPLPSASRNGKIITFFSTKGGVGKTTILTNVAVVLARTNMKVAVVDCDLQFGDTAIMFNLYPARTIASLIEEPPPWTAELVHGYMIRHEETGVELLLSPSRPEYAEIVQVEHVEQALQLLHGLYDFILVDTVPMFRNIELSILDISDRIVVITTIDLAAIKDVKLCLDLLGNLNYTSEKVALVLNRARANAGGLSPDDVRAGLKRDTILEVPEDRDDALLTSINRGKPFMLGDPNAGTPIGKAYASLASLIANDGPPTPTPPPPQPSGSLWNRLKGLMTSPPGEDVEHDADAIIVEQEGVLRRLEGGRNPEDASNGDPGKESPQ